MVLSKPIADWWFEDRSKIVSVVNTQELSKLIEMCQKCVSILKAVNLLSPEKVIFSDRWLYLNEAGVCVEGIQKKVVCIEYPAKEEEMLKDLIIQHILDEQQDVGFIYPASFQIMGKGTVIDDSGNENELSNVVSIEAQFTEVPVVDVITNCDVWLPYSLSGQVQDKVYGYNAPRLENALKQIENELGEEAIFDETSDYCRIDGYKIDNFRDADGAPIAVDEYGRML